MLFALSTRHTRVEIAGGAGTELVDQLMLFLGISNALDGCSAMLNFFCFAILKSEKEPVIVYRHGYCFLLARPLCALERRAREILLDWGVEEPSSQPGGPRWAAPAPLSWTPGRSVFDRQLCPRLFRQRLHTLACPPRQTTSCIR